MLGDIGTDQRFVSLWLCGIDRSQIYRLTFFAFLLQHRSECAYFATHPICLSLSVCTLLQPHPRQRALLEQKQKKKRQEPLMVQSTVDGRSRARRTKQSEEQAPLVESYLSSNSSTIYNGEEEERSLILGDETENLSDLT